MKRLEMTTKRKTQREKRKRKRMTSRLIWGGVIVVAVGILGYAFWVAFRPASGESIPIMAEIGHVSEGVDPGPYNSNPPSSGPHFANDLEAGFYHETDAANLPEYPEGYLVHNLEHGYVIFWYNCQVLDEQNCSELKSQIQSVIDQDGGFKLIAFPWSSQEVPLTMTSWGQLQRFETFNESQALSFIERNRNRAPEPNAP
jgi:hypothetical protein